MSPCEWLNKQRTRQIQVQVSWKTKVKTEVKVKVNQSRCLIKHNAIKTFWESGGITPLILSLGSLEVSGQLHAQAID
jgi:hypothetical protein